jgi:SAM-dependent methyltransferase
MASDPGDPVAPDGSPVAFYRRLPATGEPELIHAAIPGGATVLDIGCAAGRISGPLVALGHPVTGVDNGPGMIAALPPGVEGIVADGRTVRLGRRFGAVLLASHLVNDPEAGTDFAATAAAHLEPAGVVVGETFPPGWDPSSTVGRRTDVDDAWVEVLSAAVVGDLLEEEVRYGVAARSWQQRFRARILDEDALRRLLARSGLDFERWLQRPGWFVARIIDGSRPG